MKIEERFEKKIGERTGYKKWIQAIPLWSVIRQNVFSLVINDIYELVDTWKS